MSAGHVVTEGAVARSVGNVPGAGKMPGTGHKKDKKKKNHEIDWTPVPFASVVHGIVERIYNALNSFLITFVLVFLLLFSCISHEFSWYLALLALKSLGSWTSLLSLSTDHEIFLQM